MNCLCQNSQNTQQCSVESKVQEKQRLVEEMAGRVVGRVKWTMGERGCQRLSDSERELWFWSKVRISTAGCWEWIGPLSKQGYGCLNLFYGSRKFYRAHRLAWSLTFGFVPDSYLVCHHCDNPKCVNPSHLFLGTHQDNCDDMETKGRGRHLSGVDNGRSKLSRNDVMVIRQEAAVRKHGIFTSLARRFGVTPTAIRLIAMGKNWKSLT